MDLLHAVWLAIVQGFTEFLPISSSGHLVLAPHVMDWPDQGLAFDVAVHLGTLLAVVLYFRSELLAMTSAWFRSVAGGAATPESRLAWAVIWGTLPVAIAGFFVAGPVEAYLRSPMLVAATTAGFGILLWLADARGKRQRDEYSLGWSEVMIIGLIQALALIPGTSRSGITMTAGLLLGLTREASARFSFLLAVPVILAASVLETTRLLESTAPVDWTAMTVGVVVSALVAYLTIRWFLTFLGRIGMLPFAIYRVALAIAIVLYLG
ncbi:MAG: UDP pyrophosphate phosphatase [Gammaproteobacteria bacterium SG8_31]|jgi:undecaprenyl-diphosphatase|nr:MAG: UDP pyrophosphate phosphatase [Gammaproteobacteria bacterium SG8_31]